MENDVLDALEDLQYKGPLLEHEALENALAGGAASPEFTKLCAWLTSDLQAFCHLEETVNATNHPNEAETFQLEMSGFLNESGCVYTHLTSGDVTRRLLNKDNCRLLLVYLTSELQAARMMALKQPSKHKGGDGEGTDDFKQFKAICVTLGMSRPPANITIPQFIGGIQKKLKETLTKVPANHMGKPVLQKNLGPYHWDKLQAINNTLTNEYEVRRKMLLKRLDVTVQSFGWSDKAKANIEAMGKVYYPKRRMLQNVPTITLAHLLAARDDLSRLYKTSSGSLREKTSCAINKVRMGRVPDRGGRPNEIEPPPPEMPPWQQKQDQQSFVRGGGRGGAGYDQGGRSGGQGSGRGSKVQGGWSDGGQQGYGGTRIGYHGESRGNFGGVARGGGYGGGGQGGGYGGGGRGGHYGGGPQRGSGYGSEHGVSRDGYGSGGTGYVQPGGSYGGPMGGGGGGGGGTRNYEPNFGHREGGGSGSNYGGRRGEGYGRSGRGENYSRGRGRGGRGWSAGRGGMNANQGQFEQYFQQGGHQYNQAGFGQGQYSS